MGKKSARRLGCVALLIASFECLQFVLPITFVFDLATSLLFCDCGGGLEQPIIVIYSRPFNSDKILMFETESS